MPTIDKRFLGKIILALLLIGGTLAGVHTLQARRIPDALKGQADRAAANGKTDAAVRHLRQYLEFRPDDVAVLEQLAEMLRTRAGSHNELHFLYDRILRLDPTRLATRNEALRLAMKTGRLADAVANGEAILKATPNDAAVLQIVASAQAGLRQFDSARASFENAVRQNPQDAIAWQRYAQFLVLDAKKPQDAAVVVDRMVKALPNDANAYLTRVRLDAMINAEKPLPPRLNDPVLNDLAKALELTPDHPEALLMQAERLQKHHDIVGARTALARGVEKYPGDQRLVRSLAWLEVNRHNTAGAVGVLEDALPHAKDPLDLLVTLADLLLDTGEVAKTDEIRKKLERRNSVAAKLQAKYLKGRLAMKAAQWREAIAIFTSLRTDATNLPGLEIQANMLMATCYQKIGEPAKAIDIYKLVTAKDATQVTAFISLGQLYLNDGRNLDAIKAYEAAVVSPFAPPTAMMFLIRMHGLQLAQANAKPAEWAALEKRIAEFAPRFGPNAIEPAILRADLAKYAGLMTNAVAILKAESARHPQSTTLWCRYADAVGMVEGVAAGLAVLDEAQGFVSDNAELRLTRAKLYAMDPLKLRPIELLTAQIDSWNESEQVTLLSGIIEIQDRMGKRDRELWKRLLTKHPNDAETWLAYCRVFPRDSHQEAGPILDQLLPGWKSELEKPSMGAYDIALRRIKSCIQANDGSLEKYFEKLAVDPRWTGSTFRNLLVKSLRMYSPEPSAEILLTSGNSKDSVPDSTSQYTILKAAKAIIVREPNGFGWFCDEYQGLGNRELSLQFAESAVASPLANVEDWLRLWHLQPNDANARKGIETRASKAFSNPVHYYSFLAACMSVPNVREDVSAPANIEVTKALLAIKLARMDRAGAISILETDLDSKTLTPADRAWATRNLAMLLVVRGEVSDRERAARLLTDATISSAGTSLSDRRTTAGVLASLQRYLDGTSRTQATTKAIGILEAVAAESKSPKDAFSLCRLYKSVGRTDDAVSKINELLQGDPGNIDYLLAALDILVDARQFNPARGFADRLVQLGGSEYRVVAAVARFEALTGNAVKAHALAEGYFRSADPLSGDVPVKARRTAELHDELARMLPKQNEIFVGSAVAKYESLLPGHAEAIIRIASLLASTGRGDEAFAKLEKLQRGVSPRIVATAAVTALSAVPNAKYHAKVKTWIDAAKDEDMRMIEAEYLGLIGNHVGSAALYESVLKDQPRNVAALNNLAWLLSADPATADRALELLERASQEIGLTGELLDTRARIRLARGEPVLAIADAGEALKHDKTALRYFHLAIATQTVKPSETAAYFQEAIQRGLTERMVHPKDLETFRNMMKSH